MGRIIVSIQKLLPSSQEKPMWHSFQLQLHWGWGSISNEISIWSICKSARNQNTNSCDVLPANASNNLWILDFMLDLLVISLGGVYNHLWHFQLHHINQYFFWFLFSRNCCVELLWQTPMANFFYRLLRQTPIPKLLSRPAPADCYDNQPLLLL
jgi:hypothetical protein